MARLKNCIRMLQLLKARGMMSRTQLAAELGCNKRQILDYKRELEDAGYLIESVRGAHGGYVLRSFDIVPSNGFTTSQMHALKEARSYMTTHKDFLFYQDYMAAMDKLLFSLSYKDGENGVYIASDVAGLSSKMADAIQLCEWARDQHRCMEIAYRSMKSDVYEPIRIQPYEILHYKDGYYCLAYSLKAKDYRIYKFSEERMRQCVLCEQSFTRASDFRLLDHIGRNGLVRDEVYELELMVYGTSARFLAEKKIGINEKKEWIDKDCLHVSVVMEGKLEALHFLMSLQHECKLLAPQELKKEMLKIIEDMNKAYSS